MDILVCDRCGFELTEIEDIALALDGTDAWQDAVRARGEEPRGLFPCKYHMRCKGEMILVKGKRKVK
ncbi:MAG: hypothetical protein JW856_02475 [Dehalococcoidales bacterium]|nr:hypothetical protein [Dehalococcoidales bacterium]